MDLAQCREVGAPHGYGHAMVTFAPGGNVSRVAVDSPANLSPSAVSCIGETLGTAVAPPFDGAPVTVPTTFYVR